MITENSLITYLKTTGWIIILSLPMSMSMFEFSNDENRDLLINLSRPIYEMPTALALPLLCLCAASYLKKQPETLETIFE